MIEEREIVLLGADMPRSIDMRVIAAAKRPLEESVHDGNVRADLFHRLNVIRLACRPCGKGAATSRCCSPISSPPRPNRSAGPAPPIGTDARRHLLEHDWPGNVRELRTSPVALRWPG